MRNLYVFILLLVLISCNTSPREPLKRYQIKSAYIRFESEENGVKKEQRLYFDQWGRREAKYTTIYDKNGVENSQSLVISLPDYVYNVNEERKVALRSKNILSKFLYRRSSEQLQNLTEILLRENGGKKIGEEMIALKNCEIWDIEERNAKIWIWKGITLKTENVFSNKKQIMTAVSVDEDYVMSDEYFMIPEDYKIRDIESMVSYPGKQ